MLVLLWHSRASYARPIRSHHIRVLVCTCMPTPTVATLLLSPHAARRHPPVIICPALALVLLLPVVASHLKHVEHLYRTTLEYFPVSSCSAPPSCHAMRYAGTRLIPVSSYPVPPSCHPQALARATPMSPSNTRRPLAKPSTVSTASPSTARRCARRSTRAPWR